MHPSLCIEEHSVILRLELTRITIAGDFDVFYQRTIVFVCAEEGGGSRIHRFCRCGLCCVTVPHSLDLLLERERRGRNFSLEVLGCPRAGRGRQTITVTCATPHLRGRGGKQDRGGEPAQQVKLSKPNHTHSCQQHNSSCCCAWA